MSSRKGPTPRREWQPLEQRHHTTGEVLREGRSLWVNDLYTVLRLEAEAHDGSEPAVYLSIRRNDRRPVREWRHFQRIKNQLAGPEHEGVELYPAESRKIDGANQYHLFCFPFQLPFGYEDREVFTPEQADRLSPGAVQAPLEDADTMYGGLTDESAPLSPVLRWPGSDQIPSKESA